MTTNSAKKTALKILIKNRLCSLNKFIDLLKIIESRQFTVINYKKRKNSAHISELIEKLRLKDEIQHNDSFLYVNNNIKFLFLNEDVTTDDKCALLRHELGHICDPDFTSGDLNYSKIKREEFANEFSCYVKNPGIGFKFYMFLLKKWKILLTAILLSVCVLGLFFAFNPKTTQSTQAFENSVNHEISDETFWITPKGKKYHKRTCFAVKNNVNLTECTQTEAINSGYGPCLICIHE